MKCSLDIEHILRVSSKYPVSDSRDIYYKLSTVLHVAAKKQRRRRRSQRLQQRRQ